MNIPRRRALVAVSFSAALVRALLMLPTPANAADLLTGQTFSLMRPSNGDATLETVPADGKPGGSDTALRITVVKPSQPFYLILVGTIVPAAVPEGRRLRLRFWGRSATGSQVRAVVEKNGPPYNSALEVIATLTREWKEYTAMGSPQSYGPNGMGVKFQVGYAPGTVDLAGIRLEDLGPDPELQAAGEAITPAATQARIRKFRMGDLKVIVRDGKRKPVSGVTVSVTQTAHAFLFGSNIFNLDLTNTEAWQKAYQDRFTALFNSGTLPFYWGSFEYEKGKPQYKRMDAIARWCVDHGVNPKGHPLVWHEVYPGWAPNDAEAAIPLLHQRVTDLLTHYRGLVHIWDVVNEATHAATVPNGEGAWMKRDGPVQVVATALQWARAASEGAGNTLIYNDFDTSDRNVALLKGLQDRGALPDAIGIQSHMHGGAWPLSQVWGTTERFAQFGKPIYYTEVTVLSGPGRTEDTIKNPPHDWLTTPEGEKEQADYVARFYTLLFSHPAVRGITWWDFSDRDAWQNAPAGLVRSDMTPKPAYDRLIALIHKEWWTDVQGKTGASGSYSARAFYGDYRITATDPAGRTATVTVEFPMGSGAQTLELVLSTKNNQ